MRTASLAVLVALVAICIPPRPAEAARAASIPDREGFSIGELPSLPTSSPAASPSFQSYRTWTPVTTPDPAIARLVGTIHGEDLIADVEWLVGLGNRYLLHEDFNAVGDSLEARLAGYGLVTEQHDFPYYAIQPSNIVATQIGTVYPDSFFVVCAHYDSYSDEPLVAAPGADDNGTGVAAVLACARLLSARLTDYSIKYVLFAAEEQYMVGSGYWVADMAAEGLAIVGGLNCDMLGWWAPGLPFDLEILTNANSRWLADAMVNAADLYTVIPTDLHTNDAAWWGDFYRFWQYGYPCVNHEEAEDWGSPDLSPYYHTAEDLPENLHPLLFAECTKVILSGLATLAKLNGHVAPVPENLAANWSAESSPNPFNALTNITLRAPVADRAYDLEIYDPQGRFVSARQIGMRSGEGTVAWDGCDRRGAMLPSGAYFYRVDLNGIRVRGKVLLVK